MTERTDINQQRTVQAGRTSSGADFRCSACGEEEALRGEREGAYIRIKCERCGHSWQRDPRPACPTCGRVDLVPVAQPFIEKVRGSQTAITGGRMVYRCPSCDNTEPSNGGKPGAGQ